MVRSEILAGIDLFRGLSQEALEAIGAVGTADGRLWSGTTAEKSTTAHSIPRSSSSTQPR